MSKLSSLSRLRTLAYSSNMDHSPWCIPRPRSSGFPLTTEAARLLLNLANLVRLEPHFSKFSKPINTAMGGLSNPLHSKYKEYERQSSSATKSSRRAQWISSMASDAILFALTSRFLNLAMGRQGDKRESSSDRSFRFPETGQQLSGYLEPSVEPLTFVLEQSQTRCTSQPQTSWPMRSGARAR